MNEEHTGPSTQKGKPKYNMITPIADARPVSTVRPMTEQESLALQGLSKPSGYQSQPLIRVPEHSTHTAHMRENFDMRAMAAVANQFTNRDLIMFGGILAALMLIIWLLVDVNLLFLMAGWLVVFGAVGFYASNRTRAQVWRHSPAGVARLEQESSVIKHDREMSVEEYRIDADKEARLAEIQVRREIGMSMLNRLESKRDE